MSLSSPFTPAQLDTLLGFMRRVPLTGPEAFAWSEVYVTLMNLKEKQAGGKLMPPPPGAEL